MAEVLCGVCEIEQKKYKCPTCALPYCSLQCFKTHKTTHVSDAPAPTTSTTPALPQPPLPPPPPRYLKKRTDFSTLATNPKFQSLLKDNPVLLSSLQRVYAKTIEPDPEDEVRRHASERRAFRGRGGRGRGRGRGGIHGQRNERWTQKKGDADAMQLLKMIREGQGADKEKDSMAEFILLVEELFSTDNKEQDGAV